METREIESQSCQGETASLRPDPRTEVGVGGRNTSIEGRQTRLLPGKQSSIGGAGTVWISAAARELTGNFHRSKWLFEGTSFFVLQRSIPAVYLPSDQKVLKIANNDPAGCKKKNPSLNRNLFVCELKPTYLCAPPAREREDGMSGKSDLYIG